MTSKIFAVVAVVVVVVVVVVVFEWNMAYDNHYTR